MFLGLLDPDPDPLVRMNPYITKQDNKKNLDSYCFVTFVWPFFIFENDVNVPSKSIKQRNFFKLVFCWHPKGQ